MGSAWRPTWDPGSYSRWGAGGEGQHRNQLHPNLNGTLAQTSRRWHTDGVGVGGRGTQVAEAGPGGRVTSGTYNAGEEEGGAE